MSESLKMLIVLAVLMFHGVLLGVKLWPLLRSPLRRMAAFCRRTTAETLILSVFLVCAVHRGATKGTNGMDRAAGGCRDEIAEVKNGGTVEMSSDGEMLRSGEGAEALRFVLFEVSSNAVAFEATWPTGLWLPEGKIDLFAAHDIGTNVWELVGNYDIASADTNLVDVLPKTMFPFPSPDRLFLVLGTRADLDGDGLIDARERLMYGTSPSLADTDGDGLLDGDEQNAVPPLDPLAPDTDGDGYLDGEEVLAGTNPLVHDIGADGTIRYFYDDDDRLVAAHAGVAETSSSTALSPAGNEISVALLGPQ
jgi:hypothetical protein